MNEFQVVGYEVSPQTDSNNKMTGKWLVIAYDVRGRQVGQAKTYLTKGAAMANAKSRLASLNNRKEL